MTTRRRVGLPPGPNVAGATRRLAWKGAFRLVGGFKATGSAPYEAMVVVANHTSHADTPALIAAFPSPYKPVVVAADDYWFEKRWKALALKLAIGAVPVRRDGGHGYDTLVESARRVLGTGSSLLVFPEGTRGAGGELGEFHTGAIRLAKEFDVPLLPVAVVGTDRLLPKGGRLRPGPVEVRVGQAIQPEDLDPADPSPARDQILAMLAQGPARAAESRTYTVLHRLMDGPGGLAGAALWGFAEAISWPVTQEVYLATVAAANPRRMPHAIAALTAGSTLGVVATALAARAGHRPPQPLTTDAMRSAAATHLRGGARGLWRQAVNGAPVKVYAARAGEQRIKLPGLIAHALGSRGARAAVMGAAAGLGASRLRPVLRRAYGPYLAVFGALYALGLRQVYRHWR
jgi:1-acyl-sn-glycerol-3-phosphate acyltransferase